jgi:hypothetical protein
VEPVPRDPAIKDAIAWERQARAVSNATPVDYAAEDALLAELRGGFAQPAAPSSGPFASP